MQINAIVKNIPNQKGLGWIYWAPDWIAFIGNQSTSMQGSRWKNQCLFDFDHKATIGFEVFGQ
ncbi:MAG: glycosyl hydrolase 53 family protein [Flavobacterium sp.]|nr:glycosyl hydrolase 53 family protein [Flavobacterium sp.]